MTVAIRFVGDMERLQVKPGDVYVVTVPQILSDEAVKAITRYVQDALRTDAKVVVMHGGLKLGVMGEAP